MIGYDYKNSKIPSKKEDASGKKIFSEALLTALEKLREFEDEDKLGHIKEFNQNIYILRSLLASEVKANLKKGSTKKKRYDLVLS